MNLEQIAAKIRYTLCDVSSKTKTPHLGSSLSCTDILTALYWQVLNVEPSTPSMPSRDYFLLGKGHAASALYTTLAYRGFYPVADLYQHGQTDSVFEEHPGINSPKGVDTVSGSLGHALSLATGMALTCKIQKRTNRFYVLMGDGELNEGTIWEAAMFAAGKQLSNLVAIIDFNKLQGTGESCEIMHLEPLEEKWRAFGWHTIRLDGHNISAITDALMDAQSYDKPVCIIADTIKGKGISFMENDNNWHYRIPTQDEVEKAKQELGLK
ncbi:transketolase [Pseudoalteromonas rhizosphaerae]|uniref:transketolase n=1 Tax=Pseudoalteromonas rhizosphaerae TaxID=2518973 RepID=UPI001230C2CC|nr:transketolase [Pseudoalteromonas rhizosphaerae]|tara:strand:+ start:1778 stop:2581 length:804 start_codon:yes stop_codon:yes gene_type:complete